MSTAATRRRIPGSTKIALLFAGACAVVYFGWKAWSSYMVDGLVFEPLTPGKVNIIGVNPGKGFRIIVANQIAQLVQGSAGEFDAPDVDSRGNGDVKRVPLREMLRALQGDEKALGEFIRIMNSMGETDIPEDRIWAAEDIQKALDGDAALKAKLEKDLSVDLEGNPMPSTSGKSIENGIGIRLPVPIKLEGQGKATTMVGRIVLEYRPTFTSAVWNHLKDKFDQGPNTIAGYWSEELAKLREKPETREDVRQSLVSQISPGRAARYAEAPQKVLANAQIAVTGAQMTSATYQEREMQNRERQFDLTIDLNDEGRKRLWQFSKRRIGHQLLLVMDGIAIAAPRVEHELAQGEVTINRLHDEELVKEVVELINSKGG